MLKRKLFQHEEMICKVCGWIYKAQPDVESQWTAVEVDGHLFYICPACWGIDVKLWPPAEWERWKKDHPEEENEL